MTNPHRDAKSAWQWLVKNGGIELQDRDLPLVAMLKDRLDPEAPSLEDALSKASITVFLNAFFGIISPFIGMMSDLLAYFEKAGATEGPVNWVLVLGDGSDKLEADLDAFRRWTATANRSTRGARTVPDLSTHDLWEMRKCFYPTRDTDPTLAPDEEDSRQPEPRVKSAELTNWLDAYSEGEYRDLLPAVGVARAEKGPVSDVAALLTEIYAAIRTVARNREELRRKGRASKTGTNLWSALGLWYFESDRWVRGRMLDLEAYGQASQTQRAAVQQKLSSFFEKHSRRRMRYDIDFSDLEAILSLPAWKKRYELYSAWILTLLLKALEGHFIELEHDNGRISFAFKETLMAHVHSAVPPVTIISERRVALTNPVGHGRTAGAQPDYSFWTEDGRCPLAVECKHYKHSSTRNFADALNDYSAALGSAQIALANYGPVSPVVMEAIENDRRSRCQAVGNVNPSEAEAMEKVCNIVRKVIGEPAPLLHMQDFQSVIGDAKPRLLVIDISGSMRSILENRYGSGRAALFRLIGLTGISEIAAVDNELVGKGRVRDLHRILSERVSAGTDLGPAVNDLLKSHNAVLVMTDDDGQRTLVSLKSRRLIEFPAGTAGKLHLLLVHS
jgi:hypothetical protein